MTGSPSGSSPLARGLRRAVGARVQRGRIIPARAGFTRTIARTWCRSPDHPRSRGVYAEKHRNPTSPAGSSPLARGLHKYAQQQFDAWRIIPARAGFTQVRTAAIRRVADHPRSRGVYFLMIELSVSTGGSSPLARGLRWSRGASCLSTGIIPARAGFT